MFNGSTTDRFFRVLDACSGQELWRFRTNPDAKLRDKEQAILSVKELAELDQIEGVVPGDGWPVFRDGHLALKELVAYQSGLLMEST